MHPLLPCKQFKKRETAVVAGFTAFSRSLTISELSRYLASLAGVGGGEAERRSLKWVGKAVVKCFLFTKPIRELPQPEET